MPTLKNFGGFRIMMFIDDHNPPHVHVVTPDREAKIALGDGRVLAGDVPPKVLRRARAWIAGRRPMLMSTWREFTARQEPPP